MERNFSTLKLFCNKPVLPEIPETTDLSEIDDFAVRRGVIEEYEDELHVCLSRNVVFKWMSWLFLGISIFGMPIIFLLISIILFLTSIHFRNKYFKINRTYKMSISMIDSVIQKKYGFVLQPVN